MAKTQGTGEEAKAVASVAKTTEFDEKKEK